MKQFNVVMLFIMLCAWSAPSSAWRWQNLWQRPDQQGYHTLQAGKVHLAEQLFQSPTWKSVASYRANHFKQSATLLEKKQTPLANYNRGNALARMGQYEAAITAYNQALTQQANYPDAAHNRDLLKQLLKQQKKNQQQNQHKQRQQSKPNPSQENKRQTSKNNKQGQQQSKQDNPKKPNASQQKDKKSVASPHQRKEVPTQNVPEPTHQDAGQRKQKLSQWLKKIPDDPGGLLRRKFMRDYQRRHHLLRGE